MMQLLAEALLLTLTLLRTHQAQLPELLQLLYKMQQLYKHLLQLWQPIIAPLQALKPVILLLLPSFQLFDVGFKPTSQMLRM